MPAIIAVAYALSWQIVAGLAPQGGQLVAISIDMFPPLASVLARWGRDHQATPITEPKVMEEVEKIAMNATSWGEMGHYLESWGKYFASHESVAERTIATTEFIFLITLTLGVVVSHFKCTKWLPESVSTLIVAWAFGVVIRAFVGERFTSEMASEAAHAILMVGLLPCIVFASGWSLRHRVFKHQLFTIMTFSVFGTIISAGFVGFVSYYIGSHLGWHSVDDLRSNLAFGALISAVDPVATLTTFKHARQRHMDEFQLRPNTLMETLVTSEAVINNAAAVVLFVSVNQEWDQRGVLPASCDIALELFGSLAFGVTTSALLILLARIARMPGHMHTQTLYAIMSAFFIYNAAAATHLSGIIANLVAGAMFSIYFRPLLTVNGKDRVDFYLELTSELNEKAVFVVCGFCSALVTSTKAEVFAIFAACLCLASRLVSVATCGFSTNSVKRYTLDSTTFTWRHLLVLCQAGLRGGVSLVLAFDINESWCHHKSVIVNATFIVICVLLVVLGGTTSALLKATGITNEPTSDLTESSVPCLWQAVASTDRLFQYVLVGDVPEKRECSA